MHALVPPSTNAGYAGSIWSARFLLLYGMFWIGPGLIHSFLPDGGANSIAGLDISQNPTMVAGMFAWAGATQIAHGLVIVVVSWRYRTLVPLFLLISLIERALLSYSGWIAHVPAGGHHPPQHYGSLILLPLIAVALVGALRPAGAASAPASPPD